jgi:hypothetical protein
LGWLGAILLQIKEREMDSIRQHYRIPLELHMLGRFAKRLVVLTFSHNRINASVSHYPIATAVHFVVGHLQQPNSGL